MATEKGTLDLGELGKTIGDAVAEGQARNNPKRVTVGQYMKRQAEAERARGRQKLRRQAFQNGYEMREESLSDEAIALLNRIVKSGRYIERRVEVVLREEGETTIELHYSNKTSDMRNDLRSIIPSTGKHRGLEDMLTMIVEEQDAQMSEGQRMKDLRQSA